MAILALCWPAACFAQDTPIPTRLSTKDEQEMKEELSFLQEETVVTANAQLQPISQAPSNIYVITAEDIRHSGVTDLPTILRRVPGLSIIQLSGYEFSVSARGNNQAFANKVLLLIDGRSAYIDTQGIVPWLNLPIAFTEIKRIEVLKGPAATIYGFNAFDGIVNIITKEPEEMKGTTLQVGAGEYGTVRSSAVYANSHDRLGYRLSIGHDQNQQWQDRQALAFRNNRFNGLLQYRVNDSTAIRLEGGRVDLNKGDVVSGDITHITDSGTQSYTRLALEHSRYFVRASWSQNNQSISYDVLPAFAPFTTITDRLGRTSGIPYLTNSYDLWSQFNQPIGTSHHLIGGTNYRQNTLGGTQVTGFNREQRVGFYLQDEWRLLSDLTLTAGVRMDLQSEIHPTYSPRVALIYAPLPNHTIRLSGSVAYRPPTLVETHTAITTIYNVFGFPVQNHFHGSSALEPERIRSYEAEYQGWYFDHRIRARLAVFHNHFNNLITPTPISATESSWANSSGVADIRGAEVGLEFLTTSWLRMFANYSYQHTNQSFTDFQQRGGPSSTVNGGLRADFDNGVNGEAVVNYVGPAAYPINPAFSQFTAIGLIPQGAAPNPNVNSYTLLNLRAGYRFWQKKAEVAISAFNALNDQHREHPLGDTIGSRVMGWLTLTL